MSVITLRSIVYPDDWFGSWLMAGIEDIPDIIRRLYQLVSQLEESFPGRKFTLDGHIVGSIGEVLAAHYYGLKLKPASEPIHDAETSDGRFVQIKATQGSKQIALRKKPDYLIVLKIERDGSFTEVYNGPGNAPWGKAGKKQSNGQRPISLRKLKDLMRSVNSDEQLSSK